MKSVSTNTFGVAKWVVSPDPTQGTHTTISSAIASASAGDTILVRDGVYVENPVLIPGINITTLLGDAFSRNVIVNGEFSYSGSGTVNLSGLFIIANGTYALSVTGANPSVVIMIACVIECQNNTGINFTSSSSSSEIIFLESEGILAATGIALFSSSSAGTLELSSSNISNPASSVTANTASAGQLVFNNFYSQNEVSVSGTCQLTSTYSSYLPQGNNTALSLSGTATGSSSFDTYASGTASAISVGSGTTLSVENIVVNSSNTNAISGSGNLTYNYLTFSNSSQIQGTVTLSLLGSTPSNATSGYVWTSTGTHTNPTWQAVSLASLVVNQQVFTTSGTYTPTASMIYCTVEVVGGGGAGGGSPGSSIGAGCGGGAGQYVKAVLSAATVGASQTVTIGAGGTGVSSSTGNGGGTTSFGSIITAGGGGGGPAVGTSGGPASGGAGGSGGTVPAGGIGIVGGGGSGAAVGAIATSGFSYGGNGGASYFGGGASGLWTSTTNVANGNAASAYGSGGGGGVCGSNSAGPTTGGNGAAGVVVVTEYIA